MKYVIEMVVVGGVPSLRVHVFSHDVCHDEYPKHKHGKPVGAGFCEIRNNRVVVHGKSETLKMVPHESDLEILTNFFGGTFEQQRFLLVDHYLGEETAG